MTAAKTVPAVNGTGQHADLPVDSYRDAAPFLRRPFTPAAVKFKPQEVLGDGKGVLCVAYIDARLVIERLNLVAPHLWHDEYSPVSENRMWCYLTLDGIRRPDVGEGTGKALVSDALKRAAVKFGIGVSLYAIPQQKLWAGDAGVEMWKTGKKKPNGQDQWSARLEDAAHARLRLAYATWLDKVGRAAFGEPLDHGDAEDSQGDAEGETPAPAPAAPPEPPNLLTAAQRTRLVKAFEDAGEDVMLYVTAIGRESTDDVTVDDAGRLRAMLDDRLAQRSAA